MTEKTKTPAEIAASLTERQIGLIASIGYLDQAADAHADGVISTIVRVDGRRLVGAPDALAYVADEIDGHGAAILKTGGAESTRDDRTLGRARDRIRAATR